MGHADTPKRSRLAGTGDADVCAAVDSLLSAGRGWPLNRARAAGPTELDAAAEADRPLYSMDGTFVGLSKSQTSSGESYRHIDISFVASPG